MGSVKRGLLGSIGRTTLYEKVNAGDLDKVNIGRRGFITAASLLAYVDRLSEIASADRKTDDPHEVGVA